MTRSRTSFRPIWLLLQLNVDRICSLITIGAALWLSVYFAQLLQG